jgi:site-specific recombinase XerD
MRAVKAALSGRLHGLRRSAATHLAQQGASSRRIAQVLGWSEGDAEAMAAIYITEGA